MMINNTITLITQKNDLYKQAAYPQLRPYRPF